MGTVTIGDVGLINNGQPPRGLRRNFVESGYPLRPSRTPNAAPDGRNTLCASWGRKIPWTVLQSPTDRDTRAGAAGKWSSCNKLSSQGGKQRSSLNMFFKT